MERRELLKMIAALTGGVVVGGEVFLTGCNTSDEKAPFAAFTNNDIALLDEIAETILPRTKSPGAKDAAVGQFMTVMVNDCYTPKDQQVFHEGIKRLNEASKKMYGEEFIKLTTQKRHDFLVTLDKEAKEHQKQRTAFNKDQDQTQKDEIPKGGFKKREEMNAHYFTMMKQLTLLGFFTSKQGATQALRFVAVPGRFDSCIPYKKGDRAWA